MDRIIVGENSIPILVAITEEDHEKGLMYRKEPASMIFPYEKLAVRKFWMKNTYVPLDIIFCRAGKVVEICYGCPMDNTLVGPETPTDLVVEFPYGTSSALDLKIGDRIDVKLSNSTKLKQLSSKY
jgi:uncharacterized membrane protein (UPF0127 family)